MGQVHRDQVVEPREGLLEVAAVRAERAEFEAAGGEPVAVADEGGLIVQHPPRLVCGRDDPTFLRSGGGVVRIPSGAGIARLR